MRGHGHAARRRTRGGPADGAPTPPPTPTPTPTAARLPLSAPFTLADNSYGAQTGNIDVSQWTYLGMGCRGLPTIGLVQARGGDRLSHLIDRLAPVKACATNGAALVMNVENDLADSAVINGDAGGDMLLARIDQVIAGVRASGGRLVVTRQPATGGAASKAAAVARYHAGLAARMAADVIVADDRAVYDPQDLAQSSDGVHPNRSGAARALGMARGAALASLYTEAGIFDGGGQLPGNFNGNWNMGTLGVLTNNSGAVATRAAGFLRSRPDVPCQLLSLTGTVTADPGAGGSTGDVQLRFATPHPPGTDTVGKSPTCIAWIEITDASGGDPVGLATVAIQCGQSTGFGKTYTAAQGPWGGGRRYAGPIGIARPRQIPVQSIPMNTDLIIRGLQGPGVDIEVRLAWLNLLYTDEVAYGPATNASAAFTAGRPVLFSLPTTSPASGTLAVGGALGVGSTLATMVGGGLTRSYDAVRDGVDVGDAVPATAAAPARPYVAQASDGGGALAIRTNAANAWNGGTAMAVTSAALPVT